MVIQGDIVVITKHDTPKAVLVSVDEFNALARTKERTLDTLTGEFDELLARMQTPKARTGMKAAFDASPRQLGRAAVKAVRTRG
jgi:PHD/YefM family antitoxin component YafN of YafNO toxin-antitoxin module